MSEQQTEVVNPNPEVLDATDADSKAKANDVLLTYIDSKMDRIAEYCAHGIKPEQLRRTFVTARLQNPKIKLCTPESIILAITSAARLGLDPNGERNGAHFLPYRNDKTGRYELKLVLGYGALIHLMTCNGDVLSIDPHVVYSGEKFRVHAGTDAQIEHEEDYEIRNADKTNDQHIIAAYAVATMSNGVKKFVVLSRKELNIARSKSQNPDGAWKHSFPEMAKKTPIRNMSKWLPLDPDLAEAIAISDDGDGYDFSETSRPALPETTDTSNLTQRINRLRKANQQHQRVETPTNRPADEAFAREMSERMDAEIKQ